MTQYWQMQAETTSFSEAPVVMQSLPDTAMTLQKEEVIRIFSLEEMEKIRSLEKTKERWKILSHKGKQRKA